MVKRYGRANYTAVNLPKEILVKVDEYVKRDDFYRSRAEFIKWAIYDKLKNLEQG